MKDFFIIGNGSWGTAFGNYLANRGHKVTIYGINSKDIIATAKTNINQKYFPQIELNKNIKWTNSLDDLLDNQIIVFAINAQAVANFIKNNSKILDNKIVINLSKGIDIDSKTRLSTVINKYLKKSELIIISGPTHAEEVIKELPTAAIITGENEKTTKNLQQEISSDNFKLYYCDDLIGVEIAGALKNIIAIIIGMAEGLGLGDNTKAAIMTKGMNEIIQFAKHFGAKESTFLGLSGYGDLIVTCASKYSRNKKFGTYIGQSLDTEDAIKKVGMVVEGYYTLEVVHNIAKDKDIRIPLINYLYKILYEKEKINLKDSTLI